MVSDSPELNPFSTLEEATRLLSALPQELASRIVLIGGQALLLWAEYYLIDGATGRQYDILASDDLDFMGRRPEVIKCAAAWNAEHLIPSPDDNTPNSGLVVFNNSGVFEVVDFLPCVYGLNDKDIMNHSDEMLFGNNRVRVLSPPLCLQSRIANLSGLPYSELMKEREVKRITAAIEITRLYLIDVCEAQPSKALSKAVTYLMRDVLLNPTALSISAKYDLDLSGCFPLGAIRSKHAEIADKFLATWIPTYHDRVARRPR